MKILISGSTGLVGTALTPYLASKGHLLHTLIRTTPLHPSQARWNPPQTGPSAEALEGVEAVIHLAGENIASGRWTQSRKHALRASRILGTRLLVEAILKAPKLPRVFLGASAIGYYGERGDETLQEDSPPGKGFLPELCQAWESEVAPLVHRGVRVVNLRFGIVLSTKGGALARMLLPFRMGLGGAIGSGKQYMSWIAVDDVLGIIAFLLETPSVRGPVNAVSPQPVTNREYTQVLGKVLRRPTLLPVPAMVARLALGEMAEALLLASTRAVPGVLLRSGYHFQWADLETALHHLLHQ